MSSNLDTTRQHDSKTTQQRDSETARQRDSDAEHPDREPPADPEHVVDDLPPSSKLVYKVLEYEGELTQDVLVAESRLCARTVRHALRQLEEAGVVTSRVHMADARQSVYWIDEPAR